MITTALVLAALNAQPACWRDRHADQEVKQAQYSWIAEAIATAANATRDDYEARERAAYLIAIGYQESRWCLDVHKGLRRTGYAHGLWQLEGADKLGRGPLEGLSREATINAARVASEAIDVNEQCGSNPAARITAYAGRVCGADWPTLRARVSGYVWALRGLETRGRSPEG